MNCHQLDSVLSILNICIGVECHMSEIIHQHGFFTTGSLILIDRLLQLCQIIQSHLRSLCTESFLITTLIHYVSQKLGDRSLLHIFRKLLHHIKKLSGLCTVKYLLINCLFQRLIQGYTLQLCIFFEKCHPALSHISLRIIDNTSEGHIITECKTSEI